MDSVILGRIKKLLNLTTARGATPEEAASAAAKAQALLFEHNLTMGQVHAHSTEKKEEFQNLEQEVKGPKVSHKWKRVLYRRIALRNFCEVIQNSKNDKGFWIIGKPSNVEVCLYMCETIGDQIHVMGQTSLRSLDYGQRAFYISFCYGAIETVTERLDAQKEENIAKAKDAGTALMVLSGKEVAQAVKHFFPATGKASHQKVSRPDGFATGRAAGHHVSLNRAVGSSARESRRIG